ncbi:MAG: hypothetical protein IIT58_01585 [Treponema sp.]|nr:hypothetical protein [Treponema sp.]
MYKVKAIIKVSFFASVLIIFLACGRNITQTGYYWPKAETSNSDIYSTPELTYITQFDRDNTSQAPYFPCETDNGTAIYFVSNSNPDIAFRGTYKNGVWTLNKNLNGDSFDIYCGERSLGETIQGSFYNF